MNCKRSLQDKFSSNRIRICRFFYKRFLHFRGHSCVIITTKFTFTYSFRSCTKKIKDAFAQCACSEWRHGPRNAWRIFSLPLKSASLSRLPRRLACFVELFCDGSWDARMSDRLTWFLCGKKKIHPQLIQPKAPSSISNQFGSDDISLLRKYYPSWCECPVFFHSFNYQ